MAAALVIKDSHPISQLNNEGSKSFSFLWLDVNINDTFLYINVRKSLRSAVDCIETFEQPDQCEKYIQQTTEKCHHIAIIGEELGHDFIPRIHHYPQVFSIYIYDENSNEKQTPWIEEYPKVKIIYIICD